MEEKKQLNPEIPLEAAQIIDFLTKDLLLSRQNNIAFNLALNTIFKAFEKKADE